MAQEQNNNNEQHIKRLGASAILPLSDTSLLTSIGDFVFASDVKDGVPDSIDYLLVLGAPHIQLMKRTAQVFHDEKAKKIVACGKYSKKTERVMYEKLPAKYQKSYESEAQMIKEVLVSLGVPESVVLCEDRSTNIRENIEYGIQVALTDSALTGNDVASNLSFGICCQSFCSRRALMTFDAIVPGYKSPHLFRADTQGISYETWTGNDYARKRVFGELRRCGEYFC